MLLWRQKTALRKQIVDSLWETLWKKNRCYCFTFWRNLNMLEKKGWFRSKRLRKCLCQGSGYTYLENVRSTGIDSVSCL